MTDLSAEQNAMLERLLKKHGFRKDSLPMNIGKHVKELARELLLAVQQENANIARGRETLEGNIIAARIMAQTYSDLFLEETK